MPLAKGDRLPRLLKMIITIQARPGLSAEDLARECEVGVRQVYRDLRILDYAGVPVYNDNGYRLMDKFALQEVSFSLEEALALLYGLKLIERQKALFPVKRVKERLLSLLPRGLRGEAGDFGLQVEVADGPAMDYSGKMELFRSLNQAMRELRQVAIDYYCFYRDESNERTVDPYRLIFKDGFWYLVAFCHLREEVRLFRMDRIRRIRLTEDKFDPPQTQAADELSYHAAWGMELGEEFELRVRFWGDSARFVRETQFHLSQQIEEQADGSVIFTARPRGTLSIARWVLSFGGEAEVLAPESFREIVAEALKKGISRYVGRQETGDRS